MLIQGQVEDATDKIRDRLESDTGDHLEYLLGAEARRLKCRLIVAFYMSAATNQRPRKVDKAAGLHELP